jgi:hypothetical protein
MFVHASMIRDDLRTWILSNMYYMSVNVNFICDVFAVDLKSKTDYTDNEIQLQNNLFLDKNKEKKLTSRTTIL